MYRTHKGRKKIVLWIKIEMKKVACASKKCQVPAAACATGDDNDCASKRPTLATNSKYNMQVQKMNELEEIVEELSKQHGDEFTVEQIWAWAHLLQMKKHDSYDSPPQKPFFKRNSASKFIADGISPGKRLQYRSQCIDQLDKWHSLMERGAITQDQYSESQKTILSDIQKF